MFFLRSLSGFRPGLKLFGSLTISKDEFVLREIDRGKTNFYYTFFRTRTSVLFRPE